MSGLRIGLVLVSCCVAGCAGWYPRQYIREPLAIVIKDVQLYTTKTIELDRNVVSIRVTVAFGSPFDEEGPRILSTDCQMLCRSESSITAFHRGHLIFISTFDDGNKQGNSIDLCETLFKVFAIWSLPKDSSSEVVRGPSSLAALQHIATRTGL